MIFDLPTIRHKTVVVESQDGYVHKKTIVTRRPWFRIIWMESQKTFLLGRYRINFIAEPDAAAHMASVEAAAGIGREDEVAELSGGEAAQSSGLVS